MEAQVKNRLFYKTFVTVCTVWGTKQLGITELCFNG